ncbi:hypothetical protein ANDO1_1703 [plant metagenome]|uniref:Phage protein n=1 Tax=plant metagenome TaxID=1297885 RepID=A0A484QGE3_9ZZZZ
MQKEHRLELKGATYVMRPANATAAWRALKAAGAIFKGMAVSSDSKSVDVGVLLGNLGDPAVAEIESLVFEHTSVIPSDGQGQPFKLSARLDEHFNTCRDHMIPVLIAGVRYQYADFFAGAAPALSQVKARFQALAS